jgi:hypothetical protein
MTIQPADIQLLDLAEASRGGQWRAELEPALAAAHQAGWDWRRTLLAVVHLLVREDASPRELTEATKDPTKRGHAPRGDYQRGLAAARGALEQRDETPARMPW